MGVIMVVETHMKPIANYPNYQIDNAGNVYSIAWNKFRLLKPIPTHDGYYRVCLCKDNNKKILSIHRLVWETYVGPVPAGKQIDHIDRDKTNNSLSNLRLVSPQQNRFNTNSKGYTKNNNSNINPWKAKIRVGKKTIHLGCFPTEEQAHNAYLEAKKVYHIIDE